MKLQFNPKLDYQLEAIDSIVNIFDGNQLGQSNFTVLSDEDKTNNEMKLERHGFDDVVSV